MASFDPRIRELAARSGLTIGNLTQNRAKLGFRCRRSSQTLWVYPFSDSIWEFSCVSAFSFSRLDDFPQRMLAMVLFENSKNKRGFWCIEKLGDDFAISYMHNMPEYLLTPEEFERICWNVVTKVDDLETAILGP